MKLHPGCLGRGPVLGVEVAGALAHAAPPGFSGAIVRGAPAVDDVHEQGHRLAGVSAAHGARLGPHRARVLAAAAEVDR